MRYEMPGTCNALAFWLFLMDKFCTVVPLCRVRCKQTTYFQLAFRVEFLLIKMSSEINRTQMALASFTIRKIFLIPASRWKLVMDAKRPMPSPINTTKIFVSIITGVGFWLLKLCLYAPRAFRPRAILIRSNHHRNIPDPTKCSMCLWKYSFVTTLCITNRSRPFWNTFPGMADLSFGKNVASMIASQATYALFLQSIISFSMFPIVDSLRGNKVIVTLRDWISQYGNSPGTHGCYSRGSKFLQLRKLLINVLFISFPCTCITKYSESMFSHFIFT